MYTLRALAGAFVIAAIATSAVSEELSIKSNFVVHGTQGETQAKFIKFTYTFVPTGNGQVRYQVYYVYKVMAHATRGSFPDIMVRLKLPSGGNYPLDSIRIPGSYGRSCTHNGPANNYHAKDDIKGTISASYHDMVNSHLSLELESDVVKAEVEPCGYPESP